MGNAIDEQCFLIESFHFSCVNLLCVFFNLGQSSSLYFRYTHATTQPLKQLVMPRRPSLGQWTVNGSLFPFLFCASDLQVTLGATGSRWQKHQRELLNGCGAEPTPITPPPPHTHTHFNCHLPELLHNDTRNILLSAEPLQIRIYLLSQSGLN